MARIRPERVAGIVALSYLVIIPAGAFLVWRKIQVIDRDVLSILRDLNMAPTEPEAIIDLSKLKRLFSR